MDEDLNIIKIELETDGHRTILQKWLKVLFTTQLMSLAVSLAATLGVTQSIINLLNRVLNICLLYSMFRLSAVNDRYRKAFIFAAVQLAGSIGNMLLQSSIFSLVVSIGSLAAMYQEYQGHSEVTGSRGADLSGKWNSLFIWQLVVGILMAVGTVGATMIGIGMGSALETIVSVVLLLAVFPGMVLEVLYLVYLKRTLALFKDNGT